MNTILQNLLRNKKKLLQEELLHNFYVCLEKGSVSANDLFNELEQSYYAQPWTNSSFTSTLNIMKDYELIAKKINLTNTNQVQYLTKLLYARYNQTIEPNEYDANTQKLLVYTMLIDLEIKEISLMQYHSLLSEFFNDDDFYNWIEYDANLTAPFYLSKALHNEIEETADFFNNIEQEDVSGPRSIINRCLFYIYTNKYKQAEADLMQLHLFDQQLNPNESTYLTKLQITGEFFGILTEEWIAKITSLNGVDKPSTV